MMASPLLDLSFLTKEERKLLEKVVKEDEALRVRDRIRLGTLRQKYEIGHHHQESMRSTSQCSCCDVAFGLLWNRGASCPSCGYMTCSNCRHKPHNQQHQFICTICENKWMLDIQAKKYDEEEPPACQLPQQSSSTSRKDSQLSLSQSTARPLHGSALIKRSLTVKAAKIKMKGSSSHKSMAKMNPVDQPVGKRKSQARRLSSSEITSTDSDTEKPSPKKQAPKTNEPPLSIDAVSSSSVGKKSAPTKYRTSLSSVRDGRSESSGDNIRKSSSPSSMGQASPARAKPDKVATSLTHFPPAVEMSPSRKRSDQKLKGKSPSSKGGWDRTSFRILVSVWYSKGMLHVKVVQASGLPSRSNGKPPYSYVMLHILPDKKSKKVSVIQSPTQNPVFNETFTFNMHRSEVEGKSLLITVLDSYVMKDVCEDTFFGQVKICLSETNLTHSKAHWYILDDKEVETIVDDNVCTDLSSGMEKVHPPSATSKSSTNYSAKLSNKSNKDKIIDGSSKVAAAKQRSDMSPERENENYKITGELLMSLQYSRENLKVLITMVRGLLAVNRKRVCSPYVIGSVISEEAAEKCVQVTDTKSDTFNPVFMEEMHFNVRKSSINGTTLHLSVCDSNDDNFLGEVLVPLSNVDLRNVNENWYILQEKDVMKHSSIMVADSSYHGELDLDLMYSPEMSEGSADVSGTLKVVIGGLQDFSGRQILSSKKKYSAILCLWPDTRTLRRTPLKRIKDSSDVYEMFLFGNVTLNELKNHRALEIAIVDSNEKEESTIGCVRLGPSPACQGSENFQWIDSCLDESSHWEEMLRKPDVMIRSFHRLRPSDEVRLSELAVMYEEQKDDSASTKPVRKVKKKKSSDWTFPAEESLMKLHVESQTSTTSVKRETNNMKYSKTKTVPHFPGDTQMKSIPSKKDNIGSTMESATLLESSPMKSCVKDETDMESLKSDVHTEQFESKHPSCTLEGSTENSLHLEKVKSDKTSIQLSKDPDEKDTHLANPKPSNSGVSANTKHLDQDSSDSLHPNHGDKLLLKLMFKSDPNNNTTGNLHVEIQKAELLQKATCFVTVCLVPDESQAGKKKTRIKNGLEPVWNESFTFEHISFAKLKTTHALDVTLINWTDNSMIGHLQLGPIANCMPDHRKSTEESSHWEDMLSNPTSFVERWHLLRPFTEPSSSASIAQSQPSIISQAKSSLSSDTIGKGPDTSRSISHHHTGEAQAKNLQPEHVQTEQHEDKSDVAHAESHELDRKSIVSALSLLNAPSLYSSKESLYSNLSVCGEVMFGVWYKDGTLHIHIARASNLGLSSESSCNPYVKTYLLPDKDKKTKQKTDTKKNKQDPEYNTTINYQVKADEVQSRTLSLSVWDRGTLKRNHFMGEVRLPLSTVDLDDSTDRWYALGEKAPEGDASGIKKFSAGNIQVGIMFEPNPGCDSLQGSGTLHVKLKNATDLSTISSSKLKKVSVECTLLPGKNDDKRKTSKFGYGSCPTWEETFTFQNVIVCNLLEENVLQMVVHERKELLGGIRLGGHSGRSKSHQPWMDSTELEATSWEKMLKTPGKWINECYPLRLSMSPRQVDLTVYPPVFVSPFDSATPKTLSPVVETKDLALKDLEMNFFLHDTVSEKKSVKLSTSLEMELKELNANVQPSTASITIENTPITISTDLETKDMASKRLELKDLESVIFQDPIKNTSIPSGKAYEEMSKGSNPFDLSVSRASMASFGSTASIYSSAGGKGNYDIIGELLLGIYHSDDHLVIHVNKARGLAAANKNGLSDPYIKTYLLPDKQKQTKKKTGIKRKTLNPVYDETIKYCVHRLGIGVLTLWLSVWNWDRFGRNHFLGEVRVPLSSVDLSDSTDRWYSLVENSDDPLSSMYRGEITLSIKIDSTKTKKGKIKWTLRAHIVGATDLYHSESKQLADSFVKCFLLPDKSSSGKRKTGVIKNNSNPVWDEVHTFEKLNLDDLKSKGVLEVTVWDYSKGSSSEFIGGLRLGPGPTAGSTREEWMDSIGEEVRHWEEALEKHGEWVKRSHTLRSSMDYRNLKLD